MVVADFNGDGKRDVAVANFKDSKVSVLFGNGDGTLQTAVHYPVGVGPESLVAIDPNNSGHADLVSANGNGGLSPKGSDVTVLRNLKADDGSAPDSIVVMNTSGNPTSTYGDSVTFLATLTGDGSKTPFTGTVEFTDNSAQFDPQCNAVTPQPTGDPNVYTATCMTVLLQANPKGSPITATLKGDPYYQGNTSPPITQTVNLATPGFMKIMQPPAITYGTSSITLSGQILAGTAGGGSVYPPMGETVTITIQGQPAQTPTINDNTGDFSVNYPTGAINVVGSPYTITYHYAGDSNFNPAPDNNGTTLTVTPATPTFSVTQPAPITYGTPSITLTGKLCVTGSSPPVCPPLNDQVTITIQGQPAQTTTINDNTGDFSVTYPTGTISVTGSPYTIKYSYAGDNNNFGAAKDDTSTSLTVNPATPKFSVTQPAPITYGTSSITLSGAICVTGGACPPAGEQVTITIKGQLPQTAMIGANGAFSASIDTHALDVSGSPYQIEYDYNLNGADHNFNSATDTSTSLTVNPATPAFSGLSSPTITYGTSFVTLKGNLCVAGSSPPVCPPVNDQVTVTIQGQPPQMTTINDNTGDFTVNMYPTSTLAAGSYPIQYSFAGDGKNFNAAPDGSGTLTVSPATPTFSVTQPAPIPYGTASITLTGTICVAGSSPPVCPPAPEQITITINNVALPVTLGANGAFSTPFDTHAIPVSVSPYTITYTYNNGSDQNFGSATDTSTSLTVSQATTTTSAPSCNPPSSNFGVQVTCSVTITPQIGGIPTGMVNYTVNGTVIPECTGLKLNNGQAPNCVTSNLPVGNPVGTADTIVATYSGDSNFQTSNGSSQYTVNPAATATALSANPPYPPGSSYQQPVNFTAVVTVTSGGNGIPSGTVTFTDGATVICNQVGLVQVVGGSAATCTVASLSVGSHTITSTYNPNNNNLSTSNGSINPYIVSKANTTISPFISTQNPSVFMQPVSFAATVMPAFPGGATPSGTMEFTDNGKDISGCGSVMLSNGQAQCPTLTNLSVGQHTIGAKYSGDGNYLASPVGTLTQVVDKANTTTTLVSEINPSDVNQFVLFTATISGQYGGAPSGQVTFTSNGKSIDCPQPVKLVSQQATCNTQKLGVGTNTIIAMYDPHGDPSFNSSDNSKNPLQQVVGPTPTTTTVLTSLNPSVSEQTVTFTITITPQFHNSTSPGGSVDITDTTTNPATAVPGCTGLPVTNGQAACSTVALQSGVRSLSVNYNGDPSFQPSATGLTQTVQDFSPSVTADPGVTPGVVSVEQGFTNTSQIFSPQNITYSVAPLYGYSNTLALTCNVTPVGPGCSFASNPISFVGGMATTTVAIDASKSPPVGTYTVTVTAMDATGLTLAHSTTFTVLITNTVAAISITPGSAGSQTTVSFVAPVPTNVTFSCAQILPAIQGISCSFSPGMTTLNPNSPTSVQVTVTAATVAARLNTPNRILAALWLGIPAVVMIGSLPFGGLSRKKLLQWLGLMLVVIALLQGIGCGGGFVRPPTLATPGGSYNLLVEGKDSNNVVQTSAVIPVNILSAQ